MISLAKNFVLAFLISVVIALSAWGTRKETRDSIMARMCEEYTRFIREKCFDKDGVPLGYLDRKTMKPFRQEFLDIIDAYYTKNHPQIANLWLHREGFETYEDSFMNAGLYLDMLSSYYRATQDIRAIDEIQRMCKLIVRNYDDSQNVDPGFFKILYGGIGAKREWQEPNATDLTQWTMHGCWSAYDLLPVQLQKDIKRFHVGSLLWYVRKGYRYRYKHYYFHAIQAESGDESSRSGPHALSYYIPALLWAYELTGEKRFLDDYEWMVDRYVRHADLKTHEMQFKFFRRGVLMARQLAPEKDKAFWDHIINEVLQPLHVMKRIDDNNDIERGFEKWIDRNLVDIVMNPNVPQLDYKDSSISCTRYCRYLAIDRVNDLIRYKKSHPEYADIEFLRLILMTAKTYNHMCPYFLPTDHLLHRGCDDLEIRSRYVSAYFYFEWVDAYWQLQVLLLKD